MSCFSIFFQTFFSPETHVFCSKKRTLVGKALQKELSWNGRSLAVQVGEFMTGSLKLLWDRGDLWRPDPSRCLFFWGAPSPRSFVKTNPFLVRSGGSIVKLATIYDEHMGGLAWLNRQTHGGFRQSRVKASKLCIPADGCWTRWRKSLQIWHEGTSARGRHDPHGWMAAKATTALFAEGWGTLQSRNGLKKRFFVYGLGPPKNTQDAIVACSACHSQSPKHVLNM